MFHYIGPLCITFIAFRVRLLYGVAGISKIFSSYHVSVSFLPDVPGFQVHHDSICPPRLLSFSRARPPIFISTTSRMFSVSSLLLPCPNHYSLLLLITIAIGATFASSKISSFLRCSNSLTPIAYRTIIISVVAIHVPSLTGIGHVSQP